MNNTYTLTLTAEELELIKIAILSRGLELYNNKSNTEEYESLCELGNRIIKMQNE